MPHRRSFLVLALAAAVFPAFAQQTANRYVVMIRYKVEPAKLAEHREFVKNVSTKVMTEWLKTNPKFMGWNALELNYGGAPLAEYNFASALIWDGPPPENVTSTFEAAVKNAGFNYGEYQAKQRSLRTVVGQQLRRSVASTGASAGGEWMVVSYYKIAPNKRAELFDSLRTDSVPVFSLMVKEKVIAGWGATEVVFPRGQDFDYLAATSYNSLADAVKYGYAGQGIDNYFAKARPGKNYLSWIDFLRSSRTLYRTDLLHRTARVAR